MATGDPGPKGMGGYELVPRSALRDLELLGDLAGADAGATIWDRYESQLPQDGFARLGLHCTICLDGPCRISPFARTGRNGGAGQGICGFDAAAMNLALTARAVALGLAGLAPFSGRARADLLAAGAQVAGAAVPGAGKAGELASQLVCGARRAAAALAAVAGEGQRALLSRDRQGDAAAVGLGHLDGGRPSLLVTGPGMSPGIGQLEQLLSQAQEDGVQVVVTAGAAAALRPGGPPAVVDSGCAGLLASSGLVDAHLRLGLPAVALDGDPHAAKVPGVDREFAAALDRVRRAREATFEPPGHDGRQPVSPGGVRVHLRVWTGREDRTLVIAGAGRLRAPLGRGGVHQAVARMAARAGWKIAAAGDSASYLAPLTGTVEVLAAPLLEALSLAARAAQAAGSWQQTGSCPQTAPPPVVFPEPVTNAELAAAMIAAAAGVPTFVASELPLVPSGLEVLTRSFDGLLAVGGGPAGTGRGGAEVVAGLAEQGPTGWPGGCGTRFEQWLAGLPPGRTAGSQAEEGPR